MWHKPCRTFNPWCLCIKTRCLWESIGDQLICPQRSSNLERVYMSWQQHVTTCENNQILKAKLHRRFCWIFHNWTHNDLFLFQYNWNLLARDLMRTSHHWFSPLDGLAPNRWQAIAWNIIEILLRSVMPYGITRQQLIKLGNGFNKQQNEIHKSLFRKLSKKWTDENCHR